VMRLAVVAVLVCLSASSAVQAQAAPPAAPATAAPAAALPSHAEALAVGRATVRFALAMQVDSLVATADSATAANADLRTRLTDGLAQIAMQLGSESRLISERVAKVDGRIEYQRTADFAMVPVPLVFRVILGDQGRWRGFTANTVENTPTGEDVTP